MYQQVVSVLTTRRAYQQEAGISTGGKHIDNRVGISTGSGHIDRRQVYQQHGRCINKGQVDRQGAGVSGVLTGSRVCINNGTFFVILCALFSIL